MWSFSLVCRSLPIAGQQVRIDFLSGNPIPRKLFRAKLRYIVRFEKTELAKAFRASLRARRAHRVERTPWHAAQRAAWEAVKRSCECVIGSMGSSSVTLRETRACEAG